LIPGHVALSLSPVGPVRGFKYCISDKKYSGKTETERLDNKYVAITWAADGE